MCIFHSRMVHRRPPPQLKEIAFISWLTALDIGYTNPALAPPIFLTRALEGGTKLKDATVVRIAQEAASAGVKELVINEELLNPALLSQIAEALTVQCCQLRKLVLKLSSRVISEEANTLLAFALKGMVNLEELSLIGGANDELLKALATAGPPLRNVDFSYSSVSDDGIQALLTNSDNSIKVGKGTLAQLQHLNIRETQVTTKGCMLLLKYCQDLESLLCQWTAEAVVLMELKQCNALRLEQLFINKEEFMGDLYNAVTNLCPCLKLLSIRRPKDTMLNLEEILSEISALEDFSLLQYYPLYNSDLNLPYMPSLKRLYLSSLSISNISLDLLVQNCPLLTHMTLDGVCLELETYSLDSTRPLTDSSCDSNYKSFNYLIELRIISAYISFKPLDPSLIMTLINKLTKNLTFLHLDHCEDFKEENYLSLIDGDSFSQIEDIRLSRALNLTDKVIHHLTRKCSRLKRLVLTMLPKERREQLEYLKEYLKSNNVNLELITFTNKSFIQSQK